MNTMGKLDGKVALVTGAGSGIGQASATLFAREGARVLVSDINPEGGNETVRLIKEAGGEASFFRADVAQAHEVQALIEQAVERYGRLDYAHNNAGIEGQAALTIDYQEQIWNRVIDINLKGVWLCMKYEIPQMLRQGKGAIVNTSSEGGLLGKPYLSAYIASKHGVLGLTKTTALEYAQQGIRVNAVCPGVIHTPMVERLIGGDPEAEKEWHSMQPIGRMGTPQEIAEAVVWLCSDAASLINGHALVADGGLYVQ